LFFFIQGIGLKGRGQKGGTEDNTIIKFHFLSWKKKEQTWSVVSITSMMRRRNAFEDKDQLHLRTTHLNKNMFLKEFMALKEGEQQVDTQIIYGFERR
jgi:hypothetical protein